MQKDDTILIYQIYDRIYDGPSAGNSLLSDARREYFSVGGHVSRKETSIASGEKLTSVCKIGKNSFVWSKKCEKQLLQKAFNDENGYYIVGWNRRGGLVGKTRFSKEHRWMNTTYYREGVENTPAAVLSPQGTGVVLLEWDADAQKYMRSLLQPCPMRRGSVEQSIADARLGEPQIYAETSAGDFCYCTPEEVCLRMAIVAGRQDALPEDIALRTEGLEEENSFDSFAFIDNQTESKPMADPRKPEEAMLTAESFAIDETFVSAEDAAKADDYAADHELFSISPDEEEAHGKVMLCKPEEEGAPRVEVEQADPERELPFSELDFGISQLLKLVQDGLKAQQEPPQPPVQRIIREKAPGQTGRYSVASKNRHGVVVHAPELEQKSAALWDAGSEESAGWKAPETPAVKQIIISAEESYAYFGDLLHDRREGQGRTEMQNGHTAYEGGYHEDKREGFGTYYYKSGKICYVGAWKENLRHGQGISFSSRDGSVFIGKWKDNVPTGSGTAFDAEGNLLYTGEWKEGKRDGYGTEYRNGAVRYVGEWRGDCYHGTGTLTLANGTVVSGSFEDGKVQGLEELL